MILLFPSAADSHYSPPSSWVIIIVIYVIPTSNAIFFSWMCTIFCAKEKESYYPIQQRNLRVQTLVNLQTRRDTKYIHMLLLRAEI